MYNHRHLDLAALAANYHFLRETGQLPLYAVVKADAYGHGAASCASILWEAGCRQYAVCSLTEAQILRARLPDAEILLLSPTPPSAAEALAAGHFTQCVGSLSYAKALDHALTAPLAVHFQVDSGMHRLGFAPTEAGTEALLTAARLPHLHPDGLCSHFASTKTIFMQSAATQRMGAELASRGCTFRMRHIAATDALAFTETFWNARRIGLALYGYGCNGVRPVLSLTSEVVAIHTIEIGEAVGYGSAWVAKRRSRIATLPIGYADGLPRAAEHGGVWYRNTFLPFAGHICMDLCMVDATDCPALTTGSRITICDAIHPLTLLADAAQTIPYELLCAFSHARADETTA